MCHFPTVLRTTLDPSKSEENYISASFTAICDCLAHFVSTIHKSGHKTHISHLFCILTLPKRSSFQQSCLPTHKLFPFIDYSRVLNDNNNNSTVQILTWRTRNLGPVVLWGSIFGRTNIGLSLFVCLSARVLRIKCCICCIHVRVWNKACTCVQTRTGACDVPVFLLCYKLLML